MKKFMRMATGLCLVATMAMVSCKKGDSPANKVKGGSGLPKAEAAAKELEAEKKLNEAIAKKVAEKKAAEAAAKAEAEAAANAEATEEAPAEA